LTSSFAMQWFADLRGGIMRLSHTLVPGGRFAFATLGKESFAEWRATHTALGLTPGLHPYPSAESFPWPEHHTGTLETETIQDHYADRRAFLRFFKSYRRRAACSRLQTPLLSPAPPCAELLPQ
jgi:malonyl-CoA O-methyltransferase